MSGFLVPALPRRRRFMPGFAALIALCIGLPGAAPAAGFATLEPEAGPAATPPGMPPAPVTSQLAPAARAPWDRQAATPNRHRPAAATQSASTRSGSAQSGSTQPASAPPQSAGGVAAPDGIDVVRWGLGRSIGSTAATAEPGRPLYLWMTIEGGAAAVDRLRANGPIAIDVHWARADAASRGAPALTTHLTIGRSGLASVFAGEVARQGHFEWHSWARKDSLSAGQWTVSLTHPDGRPLNCGQSAPQPCRFSITVG